MSSERPPLVVADLQREVIAGSDLWTSLDVVAQTGSTNSDLVQAARDGAAEGAVLVAEHQYAGRGRSDRQWRSPPRAGLAVSMLLRPGAQAPDGAVPTRRWGWLPLLVGVAATDAVAAVAGLPAMLKWPNDVLVDGAKCGGILAEASGDAVVVGLGLNVTVAAGDLPQPAAGAPPATSLALAGARTTDRAALLVALLRRVEWWYVRWRAHAGDADGCGLRTAYLVASATVGQRVRALLPSGAELTGAASTVDAEGQLVLRDEAGVHTVTAGDITHLRSAG